MCEIDFEVERSGPIQRGRQVTLRLRPPLEHPCQFQVLVNGAEAKVGDHGDLRLHGVGGSGTVTITPLRNRPRGSITFKIECPDCRQTIQWLAPGEGDPTPPPSPWPPDHGPNLDPWDWDEPDRPRRRRMGFRIILFGIEVF